MGKNKHKHVSHRHLISKDVFKQKFIDKFTQYQTKVNDLADSSRISPDSWKDMALGIGLGGASAVAATVVGVVSALAIIGIAATAGRGRRP